MLEAIKQNTKEEMERTITSLINELKKVRTGRANVNMLDSVKVNYYGSLSPLTQVASVSTPDSKSFVIAPWETSILKDVEAAIIKANLGMAPQNDGKVIRLKVPELTEERRKDMVKSIGKTVEDARVAIRHSRKNANDEIKKAQKNKDISEDDEKVYLKEIQELTDKYIERVDEISEAKEKELLTL